MYEIDGITVLHGNYGLKSLVKIKLFRLLHFSFQINRSLAGLESSSAYLGLRGHFWHWDSCDAHLIHRFVCHFSILAVINLGVFFKFSYACRLRSIEFENQNFFLEIVMPVFPKADDNFEICLSIPLNHQLSKNNSIACWFLFYVSCIIMLAFVFFMLLKLLSHLSHNARTN